MDPTLNNSGTSFISQGDEFNQSEYSGSDDAKRSQGSDLSEEHEDCVKEKPLIDWDSFKKDVALKSLVNSFDLGIHVYNSCIRYDDGIRQHKVDQLKKCYFAMYPLRQVAFLIYMIMPLFEKPYWCVNNPIIEASSPEKQWMCQDDEDTFANSGLPKLPTNVTNMTYFVCLPIMLTFTYLKDWWRKADPDEVQGRRALTALTILSCIDLMMVLYTTNTGNYGEIYNYPWVLSIFRPPIFLYNNAEVMALWKRYALVVTGSMPMAVLLIVYCMYFAWCGQTLFAGTLEGVSNFNTFFGAFDTMFQLLTAANYPDCMLPSYNQNRITAFFFLVFSGFGIFVLMQLLLAIFYNSYQAKMTESIDLSTEERNAFCIMIFNKIDIRQKGYLDKQETLKLLEWIHFTMLCQDYQEGGMRMSSQHYDQIWTNMIDGEEKIRIHEFTNVLIAYDMWVYERDYQETMEDLYGPAVLQAQKDKGTLGWKKEWLLSIQQPGHEMGIYIIGLINVMTLTVQKVQLLEEYVIIRIWICIQITFNLFFLCEMLFACYLNGSVSKAFYRDFKLYPESGCQIMAFLGTVMFVVFYDDFGWYLPVKKIFEFVIFLRMSKMLNLLKEHSQMKLVMETIGNIVGPIRNLLCLTLLIMYEFSLLGMFLFGGIIRIGSPAYDADSEIPPYYYLCNFNDLLTSYITLFILMVENEWQTIAGMFMSISPYGDYCLFYFIVFYYLGVLIGLNIVLAFAIDMYKAVSRLDVQKNRNEEHLWKLSQMSYNDFQQAVKKDADIEKELKQSAIAMAETIFNNFDKRLGTIHKDQCKLFAIGLAMGQKGTEFERQAFEEAYDAFDQEFLTKFLLIQLCSYCLKTQIKAQTTKL